MRNSNILLDISERHLNKNTFLDIAYFTDMFLRLFCCLKKVTSYRTTRSVRIIYSRRLFIRITFGPCIQIIIDKGVVAFFHWILETDII